MYEVHKVRQEDIDRIAELEAEIFLDAWSAHAVQETFWLKNAVMLGAYEEDQVIGYVILYDALDEGEIVRIAVDPVFRRQGAASHLLLKLEDVCEEIGVKKLFLEVRQSNAGAIDFYKEDGFTEDGVRKNFYTNPQEDGILMSRELGK